MNVPGLVKTAGLVAAISCEAIANSRRYISHVQRSRFFDFKSAEVGMGLPEIRGGTFQIDTTTAGRLADEGVRKAVVFRFVPIPSCEENLHAAGIEVEPILVTVKAGNGYLERLHHAAMTAVFARFSSRASIPDLAIFADDHLAYGGFTALAALKLDIPRRMRVLTMANRGFAPTAPFPYDTILIDPFANAAHLADAVAARLEKRAFDYPCPHATFMPSDAKS